MKITKDELDTILAEHNKWLAYLDGGKRAVLRSADLQEVNLRRANLRGAELAWSDLSNSSLQDADFYKATLFMAKLRDANLTGADLKGADLRGADLRGANLDYSCLPLWCGSRGMIVDRRIAAQIAAHFCSLDCNDPDYQAAREALLPFAKTSHRWEELKPSEES